MLRRFSNARHERTAHFRDGRFVRLYGPGHHWVWTLGSLNEFVEIDVRSVIEHVDPSDLLPAELPGAARFELSETQRRVVFLDGALSEVLGPGRYRQWTVGARVTHLDFDLHEAPEALEADDRLPRVRPEWAEHTADRGQALVLYRNGRPIRALERGRYRFWNGSPWACLAVSLASQELEIAVQDLVSADQVPVRVKPVASFAVTEPLAWLESGQSTGLIYTAVQLALREAVAARTLDALLAEREALAEELLARARALLGDLGVSLERAAIKDVILPGEVKEQFNKVTVARKEAEATAIRRREEVAHTRQLSNTAKLLAQNPVLMRLKEMEQLAELAGHVDKLTLVGGADLVKDVLGGRLLHD